MADVAVIGGGPVGLMLAGDLAAAGVSCTVLEQRAAEPNLTRAFVVHARTLELLDARGIGDDLVRTGLIVDKLVMFDHVKVDLARLHSRYAGMLSTPQYNVEAILEKRALALGVTILRGREVTGIRQDGTGVEVRVRLDDGGGDVHRVRYAVGADGVNSTTRASLALPFPGRNALRSIMLADVRLRESLPDHLVIRTCRNGFAFLAPFGDGWYRVFGWNRRHQVGEHEPVELEEVKDITRQAFGTDFGMHDPRWLSRFTSDERQVPTYRIDRVFLAGDAAHVHSPAGAQGLNAGLQDAANLGWKLAAAVHGWAPPELLDTYQAERHPAGRTAVRLSSLIVRLATFESAPARFLRTRIADSLTRIPPVASLAARRFSGLATSYAAPSRARRPAGRRVPDVLLSDGRRLYEALRSGRYLLLSAHPDGLSGWDDRVDHVAPRTEDGTVRLVRPDGYLAWTSRGVTRRRRVGELRRALIAWCGTPAIVSEN